MPHAVDMPSLPSYDRGQMAATSMQIPQSSARTSIEKSSAKSSPLASLPNGNSNLGEAAVNGERMSTGALKNGIGTGAHSVSNGTSSMNSSESTSDGVQSKTETSGLTTNIYVRPAESYERPVSLKAQDVSSSLTPSGGGYFTSMPNGAFPPRPLSQESQKLVNGDTTHTPLSNSNSSQHLGTPGAVSQANSTGDAVSLEGLNLRSPQVVPHRLSSPPAPNITPRTLSSSSLVHVGPPQLRQRHTLDVPKLATTSRISRDLALSNPNDSGDVASSTGSRFSPIAAERRRASLTLGRRLSRSLGSDMHLDDVPQDEDAARWAEAIRQKRASKRKRKEDEEEDRVVVGTKVDQNHVNWVTAYNMLTGIRFTVSRTNAKIDRELTDADFDAKHKFSFDITGNELTPSAKYDFKFKDYAPWVFRHLRTKFELDPADYLMSLTSKYILSELGSPGKSGSFFYFSRDYKYIIKTIHHAEHKFLRKILRDYYYHVQENPNTLLSQFYGLHRVKIPYGRKIHFVIMNNLFPPHRDIHQTFDLKGSTIGRDFKEENLEKNPRATLKDLNWLRRNLHLEFGPTKKHLFVDQMERDVKLLQRLHIMDYSMLIGIHDVKRGNEENLRDKLLRVFQPGGERSDDIPDNMLTRTPSKLETARKAKELREVIKREKPVPIHQSLERMPDAIDRERKHLTFYGDDGGFQATHEDDRPGDEIYYLGIIDCLTHYGMLKKAEHFWKGLSNPKSQISPVPPESYGDRFVKFITAVTKSPEEADREKISMSAAGDSRDGQRLPGQLSRSSTDVVLEKAERQARKTERKGANEEDRPDRKLATLRSPSADRSAGVQGSTLPVVEEAGEGGSTSGRSGGRDDSIGNGDNIISRQETVSPSRLPDEETKPPPTPEKDRGKNKILPMMPFEEVARPPVPSKEFHVSHDTRLHAETT